MRPLRIVLSGSRALGYKRPDSDYNLLLVVPDGADHRSTTLTAAASPAGCGLAMADYLRTSLVSEAFRMAVTARSPQPGLVFHADRGSQYTSRESIDLLAQHGAVSSLGRPHQCWDNAVTESFFAPLKTGPIHRRSWPNLTAVRPAVFESVEGYTNSSGCTRRWAPLTGSLRAGDPSGHRHRCGPQTLSIKSG